MRWQKSATVAKENMNGRKDHEDYEFYYCPNLKVTGESEGVPAHSVAVGGHVVDV